MVKELLYVKVGKPNLPFGIGNVLGLSIKVKIKGGGLQKIDLLSLGPNTKCPLLLWQIGLGQQKPHGVNNQNFSRPCDNKRYAYLVSQLFISHKMINKNTDASVVYELHFSKKCNCICLCINDMCNMRMMHF